MYMHNWSNGGDYGYGQWGMMSAGFGGHEWGLWALAIAAPFIIFAVAWSILWKGLALWHAGRRNEPWWFLGLLVINTLGILEIIYLFGVAKLKFGELFSRHEHRGKLVIHRFVYVV